MRIFLMALLAVPEKNLKAGSSHSEGREGGDKREL